MLGMQPADCLVIEDAPAGIQAAHAGGMKVIGITSTYPAAELEADVVIQKLAHIKVNQIKASHDRVHALSVQVE